MPKNSVMPTGSAKRYFPLQAREEEWDEAACRAFNPDNMIDGSLPSGAVARVSPDISPESLAALDRLMLAAVEHVEKQSAQQRKKP